MRIKRKTLHKIIREELSRLYEAPADEEDDFLSFISSDVDFDKFSISFLIYTLAKTVPDGWEPILKSLSKRYENMNGFDKYHLTVTLEKLAAKSVPSNKSIQNFYKKHVENFLQNYPPFESMDLFDVEGLLNDADPIVMEGLYLYYVPDLLDVYTHDFEDILTPLKSGRLYNLERLMGDLIRRNQIAPFTSFLSKMYSYAIQNSKLSSYALIGLLSQSVTKKVKTKPSFEEIVSLVRQANPGLKPMGITEAGSDYFSRGGKDSYAAERPEQGPLKRALSSMLPADTSKLRKIIREELTHLCESPEDGKDEFLALITSEPDYNALSTGHLISQVADNPRFNNWESIVPVLDKRYRSFTFENKDLLRRYLKYDHPAVKSFVVKQIEKHLQDFPMYQGMDVINVETMLRYADPIVRAGLWKYYSLQMLPVYERNVDEMFTYLQDKGVEYLFLPDTLYHLIKQGLEARVIDFINRIYSYAIQNNDLSKFLVKFLNTVADLELDSDKTQPTFKEILTIISQTHPEIERNNSEFRGLLAKHRRY